MTQMKLGVARTLLRKHADEVDHREGQPLEAHAAACRQLAGYSSNQLELMGRRYHWVLEEADAELARLENDEDYRDGEAIKALRRLLEYHDAYREVAKDGRVPCKCEPGASGTYPRAEFDIWTNRSWCTVCDHFRVEEEVGGVAETHSSSFRLREARQNRIEEIQEGFRERHEEKLRAVKGKRKGVLRRLIGL